jgi:hypothetical protein
MEDSGGTGRELVRTLRNLGIFFGSLACVGGVFIWSAVRGPLAHDGDPDPVRTTRPPAPGAQATTGPTNTPTEAAGNTTRQGPDFTCADLELNRNGRDNYTVTAVARGNVPADAFLRVTFEYSGDDETVNGAPGRFTVSNEKFRHLDGVTALIVSASGEAACGSVQN